MVKYKVCLSCKESKITTEYYNTSRDTPRSYCKSCDIKKAKEWLAKNPEKRKEIRRNYYHRNKERLAGGYRAYYLANKEKIFARERRRYLKDPLRYSRRKRENAWSKFGGSYELFYKLLEQQNNCCAICGNKFDSNRKPQFDHDHNLMKPRGILCVRCNTNLPYVSDKKFVLQATLYLKRHNEAQDKEPAR